MLLVHALIQFYCSINLSFFPHLVTKCQLTNPCYVCCLQWLFTFSMLAQSASKFDIEHLIICSILARIFVFKSHFQTYSYNLELYFRSVLNRTGSFYIIGSRNNQNESIIKTTKESPLFGNLANVRKIGAFNSTKLNLRNYFSSVVLARNHKHLVGKRLPYFVKMLKLYIPGP